MNNISIRYRTGSLLSDSKPGKSDAVKNVSFSIRRGETLALAGETGSGKSSIAMSILHFVRPDSGTIYFQGKEVWSMSSAELKQYRKKIQPVFQNADESLNPRMKIWEALDDALSLSGNRKSRNKRIAELLKSVQLPDEILDRFPHQLSGGQKQRVCIARALATEPEMLILDEAISSQDLSIQANLIRLLIGLKQKLNLTYLFISHDLPVVRLIADNVGILKNGQLVETGETQKVFESPENDYTKLLLKKAGILQKISNLY